MFIAGRHRSGRKRRPRSLPSCHSDLPDKAAGKRLDQLTYMLYYEYDRYYRTTYTEVIPFTLLPAMCPGAILHSSFPLHVLHHTGMWWLPNKHTGAGVYLSGRAEAQHAQVLLKSLSVNRYACTQFVQGLLYNSGIISNSSSSHYLLTIKQTRQENKPSHQKHCGTHLCPAKLVLAVPSELAAYPQWQETEAQR